MELRFYLPLCIRSLEIPPLEILLLSRELIIPAIWPRLMVKSKSSGQRDAREKGPFPVGFHIINRFRQGSMLVQRSTVVRPSAPHHHPDEEYNLSGSNEIMMMLKKGESSP